MPSPTLARAACPRPFRGLLSAVARTFQSGFCDYRTSNALQLTVKQFGPWSPLSWRLTMASADFCHNRRLLSKALASSELFLKRHRDRSLRVRRVTFLPHIRCIYSHPARMTLDFESLRPLVHQVAASYAVRVPRTGSLPAASVRFQVAPDTLAVRLEVPVIKASIGTCTRLVTSWLAFAYQLSSVSHDAARHA